MKWKTLLAALSMLLVLTVSMPASLLIAPPPKAEASYLTLDIPVSVTSALSSAYNAIVQAGVWAQKALVYLEYINQYVLQPLAFIQSGKAVQAITGGILTFVTGQSNGTGQSQFATNLVGQLQGAGTNQALAFTAQLQKSLDSPYSGVISSSLQRKYLQESSLQGFFSANKSTLANFTNGNPTAFLAGNWSQGGVRGWLALTTQKKNNPYLLFHDAGYQLASQVTTAASSVATQLGWGKGFMSWCGASESAPEDFESCDYNGTLGYWENGQCNDNTLEGQEPAELPVSPGSPCANKDGTPGEIKTPGSVISGHLEKSMGLSADKVAQLGDASTQITSLIAGIMQTVQLAQSIIGGSGGNPNGGLAGVADSYIDPTTGEPASTLGGYGSFSDPTSSFAGVNTCDINVSVTGRESSDGTELLDRAAKYETAWATIGTAVTAASTTVHALVRYCTPFKTAAENAANTTAAQRINKVIAEANYALFDTTGELATRISIGTAYTTAIEAATSTEVAQRLIDDTVDALTTPDAAGECPNPIAQLDALQNATPTISELEKAIYNALGTSAASSTMIRLGTTEVPSLHLSNGTYIDQMKLLVTNAELLKPYCVYP